MMMVSVSPKTSALRMFSALFYNSTKILETWESDDKVAVIWLAPDDASTQYQRDRLSSGLFPTYVAVEGGLQFLAEEMGLNIPCVQ